MRKSEHSGLAVNEAKRLAGDKFGDDYRCAYETVANIRLTLDCGLESDRWRCVRSSIVLLFGSAYVENSDTLGIHLRNTEVTRCRDKAVIRSLYGTLHMCNF